jgi:hypothetical protein
MMLVDRPTSASERRDARTRPRARHQARAARRGSPTALSSGFTARCAKAVWPGSFVGGSCPCHGDAEFDLPRCERLDLVQPRAGFGRVQIKRRIRHQPLMHRRRDTACVAFRGRRYHHHVAQGSPRHAAARARAKVPAAMPARSSATPQPYSRPASIRSGEGIVGPAFRFGHRLAVGMGEDHQRSRRDRVARPAGR